MSRTLKVLRGRNEMYSLEVNPDDEVQLERTAERGWNIIVTTPVAGDGLIAGLEPVTEPVTEIAGLQLPAKDSLPELKKAANKSPKKSTAKRTSKKEKAK
jgi:hypothetical protein